MYSLHKKQVCLHLKRDFLVGTAQKMPDEIGDMPKPLEGTGKKRPFKLGQVHQGSSMYPRHLKTGKSTIRKL